MSSHNVCFQSGAMRNYIEVGHKAQGNNLETSEIKKCFLNKKTLIVIQRVTTDCDNTAKVFGICGAHLWPIEGPASYLFVMSCMMSMVLFCTLNMFHVCC